jgi:single-stranded-DNA-specific exonuclease
MGQAWTIKEPDPEEVEELAEKCNLDHLLARCLVNRGVCEGKQMKIFLQPRKIDPIDPFLMPDMHVAVERILKAVQAGERICIYGDYDADGVTAISMLAMGLRELGGDVFYYIPDRFFEGVGLHKNRLRLLKQEDGVGLVITVDTGIRAFDEMEYAAEIGLDIIVTDHHLPDDRRPPATAVLNPKISGSHYPFDGLCGAGVAFKVLQALEIAAGQELNLARYIQIAALGTIADMVPLRDENRWLVATGLKEIERDEQGPIRTLLRRLGLRRTIDALDISFKVAPRINAPGRLGDPDTAIAFLTSDSPREIAELIDILDGMNTVRQMLERELQAKLEFQLTHLTKRRIPPFIMLAGRHWHRGILGIMACKIMRRYQRPTCIISFDDEMAHGSMRSVEGINLLDPLQKIAPLLTNFGGHPQAAGVTLPITNLPQFKARMTELLAPRVDNAAEARSYQIDAEIEWRDLNHNLLKLLTKMAPFGIGNALPVFLSPNLILESEPARKGPWYHFEVSDGCVSRKCSFYQPIDLTGQFERFDSVDLIYSVTPYKDDYQVQIVEMRPSRG